jgi:hypothetical protein
MTAGSLSGGGVAGGGGGVDGCNAKSEPTETLPSPSSCGMVHICSVFAPSRPFVGLTGCGHFRLAGGAGGDGLVTAPALPVVAATSFLATARMRRIAAFAATVGSVAITASQYVGLQLLLGALLLRLLPLLLLRLLWELLLLLLLHPGLLGHGRPWLWRVACTLWPRRSFFSSRALACGR